MRRGGGARPRQIVTKEAPPGQLLAAARRRRKMPFHQLRPRAWGLSTRCMVKHLMIHYGPRGGRYGAARRVRKDVCALIRAAAAAGRDARTMLLNGCGSRLMGFSRRARVLRAALEALENDGFPAATRGAAGGIKALAWTSRTCWWCSGACR